ncbi:APC family permease [Tenacibaculum amylolyticum]|uniref:APC family permease n=1 Tax=Tenacibaculum amylolyticum TaxID=104269 RepID=UPI0038961330
MKNQSSNAGKLTVLPLLFMTAALFMTLRNMPAMAQTGLQMVFFNFVTVFAFLIPIALVSAELATGWPENGVFHWVEAAFGTKAGFLAVWLQWIQSIFGITSILAYVGGTLAYTFNPELGNNKYFITISILVIYWVATFMNFKGTKRSGQISSIALNVGVLFPTVLLIIAGIIYAVKGNPIHIDLSLTEANLVPSITNTGALILFLNFVFGFVGIEVSATHAKEVVNPQRNFPIALFAAAIIGFLLTLFGAFAVGFIVPLEEINSVNGAIQAFSLVLTEYHLQWIIPIIAFLIAMGAAGQVSTWVVGPIKGLWAAGIQGNLPTYFQKVNKDEVPTRMLIGQAIFISLIGLLFLVTSNVNSMFLILTAIAVILYCIMYILMFASAIKLRYTQPDVHRAYKVPGGKFGIWLVCGIGALCALACFFIGFIPPTPLPVTNTTQYFILLTIVILVFVAIPFIIYKFRKKSWKAS